MGTPILSLFFVSFNSQSYTHIWTFSFNNLEIVHHTISEIIGEVTFKHLPSNTQSRVHMMWCILVLDLSYISFLFYLCKFFLQKIHPHKESKFFGTLVLLTDRTCCDISFISFGMIIVLAVRFLGGQKILKNQSDSYWHTSLCSIFFPFN